MNTEIKKLQFLTLILIIIKELEMNENLNHIKEFYSKLGTLL